MGMTIGVAGKGGVGKTTLAGLAVKYLISTGRRPVLAVDADSNYNLNEVLGLEVEATLGDAREEMKREGGGMVGMTKDVLIEMRANQALVEAKGYDLIVMGRPEGPGCYCAANTVLTTVLEKLVNNYPWMVIDNEAGMEHVSRLTTKQMDIFYVVSDASRRGLTAAKRIWELVDELKIRVGEKHLILNQVKGEVAPELMKEINEFGMNLAGVIPEDDQIYEWDQTGKPTSEISRTIRPLPRRTPYSTGPSTTGGGLTDPAPRPKIVILGLDGVGWTVMRRLTEDGVMPRLAAMLLPSACGPMLSTLPEISPVAGPLFSRPALPAATAFLVSAISHPGSYDVRYNSSMDIKTPFIWTGLACATGARSC